MPVPTSATATAVAAETTDVPAPRFAVIGGEQVEAVLRGREQDVVELVRATYLAHEDGETVNPPSYFLRFPDQPADRIIALPASIRGTGAVDGIKWISSFPGNVARGIPRASAVAILNDPVTGYPYACIESSIVSASRTAASAALAARTLSAGRPRPTRLGIVGTGLIARYIHHYLAATGWDFEEIGIHDLRPESSAGFAGYLADAAPGVPAVVHESLDPLVTSSDLVVLATVAPAPYATDPALFAHHPLVLNVSLRDLGEDVVLGAQNIVDDVEHCLKAATSVHLAELRVGHRDFIDGTLAQVLQGTVAPATDRTVVFSPFGLGVLDLALARLVHVHLEGSGALTEIPGFFHDMSRYGRR